MLIDAATLRDLDVLSTSAAGGQTVLELVDDFDSNTYRAVYTVRFAGTVYVPHAFQKKAKKGIATPQQDIELIKSRLRNAEEHYRARADKGGRKP